MPSFWDVHANTNRSVSPPEEKGAKADEGPWSVSVLNRRVADALSNGLPSQISVRGEISRWSKAQSGHRYFTLKDADSSVDAKMWRSAAAGLSFEPRDGQEVLVAGRIDYWTVRGQVSLVAERIEPVGQGALELAFRQLVEKLRKEGLFEPSRKKVVPEYPERIALVTSPNAAGLGDVLKVLGSYRHLKLMLYPVPVQGSGAAEKIASALTHLDARHREVGGVDVVLLVRGGGSIEDLWSFNEEVVARALAAMRLPTVCGVGHEVDTTVADLVADVRAHTPTEAAQSVVRNWRTAGSRVEQLGVILRRDLREALKASGDRLETVRRHEVFRRPLEPVERRRQLLDEADHRLSNAGRRDLRVARERLTLLQDRLSVLHPRQRLRTQAAQVEALEKRLDPMLRRAVRLARDRLDALDRRLITLVRQQLARSHRLFAQQKVAFAPLSPLGRVARTRDRVASLESRLTRGTVGVTGAAAEQLERLEERLRALNPTEVLRRGYTLTLLERTGRVLTEASTARPGDVLVTRTAEGDVTSVVGRPQQGDLFRHAEEGQG